MYLRIISGNIEYPYSIQDLKFDNPNVSFPRNITESTLESFDMYKVHPKNSGYDDDYTKDVEESTPILSGSIYVQDWNVTDADQTTIDKRLEIKWNEVRETRDQKLQKSDWVVLSDSPITGSKLTEWETYRQDLRNITEQTNPFQITWPDIPS